MLTPLMHYVPQCHEQHASLYIVMKLTISARDEERCDGVVERRVDDSRLTAGNFCWIASVVNSG